MAVMAVMCTSLVYEWAEWGIALMLSPDAAEAYNGQQGDVWDAQKDMALASLGALIAMCVTAAVNYHYQRDFAREWQESLRVKRRAPL